MGKESSCVVSFNGKVSAGKAYLETNEILFRGDFRLSIPLKEVKKVYETNGKLTVKFSDGVAVFELGKQAEKWATAIKNPRSLIDKLGVKPNCKVTVLGINDEGFLKQLKGRAKDVSDKLQKDNDIIFFAAEERNELSRLSTLQNYIKRDGAIWIVTPKGKQNIKDTDVITAARGSGLADVKVVRFSGTYTAQKLVIPLSRR